MVGSPAYADFLDMVRRARDGVTRDLVLGTRDKHGDDNAEAKRAMIYVFNAVLHFYDDIERRAVEARNQIKRLDERRF
jgi:hypothetical protein